MTDILEKAVSLGLGIGEKVKEKVDELIEAGEKTKGGGLGATQEAENRFVDEAVKLISEILKHANVAKEKAESLAVEIAEGLADRLKLATKDELDVVEKLALIAREKVEALEKRVKALEEQK
jgi:BMFP domain-containing protein YqiC